MWFPPKDNSFISSPKSSISEYRHFFQCKIFPIWKGVAAAMLPHSPRWQLPRTEPRPPVRVCRKRRLRTSSVMCHGERSASTAHHLLLWVPAHQRTARPVCRARTLQPQQMDQKMALGYPTAPTSSTGRSWDNKLSGEGKGCQPAQYFWCRNQGNEKPFDPRFCFIIPLKMNVCKEG